MLDRLKQEQNITYTENGAATYASSLSDCLDLFATVGALRAADDEDIIKRFVRAYAEDKDRAVKILFFARDIRGGLGERKTFRTILRWMANHEPQSVIRNLPHIAEFGRYDDLLVLLHTNCEGDVIRYIADTLAEDLMKLDQDQAVSLLAKWLPSVNATNFDTRQTAKYLVKKLKMQERDYRRMLSRLRAKIQIIENHLREKDYTFDYDTQPAKALFKYRSAFARNDEARYNAYLDGVVKGERRMNTDTLMPYEVIRDLTALPYEINQKSVNKKAIQATWDALPDYTDGRNAMVVIDGSASMYWTGEPKPAAIALSLGIYFAERNKGVFHNHFITFSERPKLVQLKGKTVADKVRYAMSFDECANTNIQGVFDLILKTAVKNRLTQDQLPETIYIISDMEFDDCADGADITNFAKAKDAFAKQGYKLPQMVFWNVQSRNIQQPVTMNEQGVVLVSGCTPKLFAQITSGDYSPYDFMEEVIGSPRYSCIAA